MPNQPHQELREVAGYRLDQVVELVDSCAESPDSHKDSIDYQLLPVMRELTTMMANPEYTEAAARWFAYILLQPSKKCHGYTHKHFILSLFTTEEPSLLQAAIEANNPICLQAINQLFNHPKRSYRLGNFFATKPFASLLYPSLLDRLFHLGHFALVKRILQDASLYTVQSYNFSPLGSEKGISLQREALCFFVNNNNEKSMLFQLSARKPHEDEATQVFINEKIHALVSEIKQVAGQPGYHYRNSFQELLLWAECSYTMGNKEAYLSIYAELKDLLPEEALNKIIKTLRQKASLESKNNSKAFELLYEQLKDSHKVILISEHFYKLRTRKRITRFLTHQLNPDQQRDLAMHCDEKRWMIIPDVPKMPYSISSQVVKSASNPYNYSLLHYWLIANNTYDSQIAEWLKYTRSKTPFTDHCFKLLAEVCFYFRERARNPKERTMFWREARGISKSDKLEAVGKLMTKMLDPDAHVHFSTKDVVALKQGKCGEIYKGYSAIIDEFIAASPSLNETERLSMDDESTDENPSQNI